MSPKKRVLALNFLAGIWPHTLQFTNTLLNLDETEIELTHISCGGLAREFCTVMESKSRRPDAGSFLRSLDCQECKYSARLAGKTLQRAGFAGANTVFLNERWTQELEGLTEQIVSKFSPDNLDFSIELSGVKVLPLALYETILKYKKLNLNFSKEEFNYLKHSIRNVVRVLLVGEEYLKQNSDFHCMLVYLPQYGINNALAELAFNKGIKVYSVDGSANIAERYSSVVVKDWNEFGLLSPALFQSFSINHEISIEERNRLDLHKRELASGRSFSVYSQGVQNKSNLRNELNIKLGQKVWLLALSSLDEAIAGLAIGRYPNSKYPGKVFSSQFEWVQETISWLTTHPEIFAIIRMHPRDFPNKRESVRSEQSYLWEEFQDRLPDNVILNSPDQNISISSLLEITDTFITGWSSTTLESLDMGIPSISYDSHLLGFSSEICITGSTKEEYFANLENALSSEKDASWQRAASAWLAHLTIAGTSQVGGRILEKWRLTGPRFVSKILNGMDVYLYFIFHKIDLFRSLKMRLRAKNNPINTLVLHKLDSIYEAKQRIDRG